MIAQYAAPPPIPGAPVAPTLQSVAYHQPANFPLAGPWPLEHSPMSWDEVWQRLVAARIRFRSSLWSSNKCIIVFRQSNDNARQFALTQREQVVFQKTLQGVRQKAIAAQLEAATSTVANCLKSAMLKMGFRSRLEATPLAALNLSHAGTSHLVNPSRPVFSVGQEEFIVATAPEPDWTRFPKLTNTEKTIASFIIQGKGNTDIAKSRATSIHTVENQVASLFSKLGAGGRFDLLKVLYQ